MSLIKIRGTKYEVNVLDIFLYLGSIADVMSSPNFFRQPENVSSLGLAIKGAIPELPETLITKEGKLNLLAEELTNLLEDCRYAYFLESREQAKQAGDYKQEFINAKGLAKLQAENEQAEQIKSSQSYGWYDEDEDTTLTKPQVSEDRVFFYFQQYYQSEISTANPERAVKLRSILDQATTSFLSKSVPINGLTKSSEAEQLRKELADLKAKLPA